MDNNKFYEMCTCLSVYSYRSDVKAKFDPFALDSCENEYPTLVPGKCSQLCVVPRDKVSMVIDMCHRGLANNPHVAHCSRDLTLRLVRAFFYWEGQDEDVDDRIAECKKCAQDNRTPSSGRGISSPGKGIPSPGKGIPPQGEEEKIYYTHEMLWHLTLCGKELAECLRGTELAKSGFHYDKSVKYTRTIYKRVDRLKRGGRFTEKVKKELQECVAYFKGLTVNVNALMKDRSRLYGSDGVVAKRQDRYEKLLQSLRTESVTILSKKAPQKPAKPAMKTNRNKVRVAQLQTKQKKFFEFLCCKTSEHGQNGPLFVRLLQICAFWYNLIWGEERDELRICAIKALLEKHYDLEKNDRYVDFCLPDQLATLSNECFEKMVNTINSFKDEIIIDDLIIKTADKVRFLRSGDIDYLLYLLRMDFMYYTDESILSSIRNYTASYVCKPSCQLMLTEICDPFIGIDIGGYYNLINQAKLDVLIDAELKLFESPAHEFQVFQNTNKSRWFICVFGMPLTWDFDLSDDQFTESTEYVYVAAVHMDTSYPIVDRVETCNERGASLSAIYKTLSDVVSKRIKQEDQIYFPVSNAYLIPLLYSLSCTYEMIYNEFADLFVGYLMDFMALISTEWDPDLILLHDFKDDFAAVLDAFRGSWIGHNKCLPPKVLFETLHRSAEDIQKILNKYY